MRISDEDRSLAKMLVEVMGGDNITEGLLRTLLAVHRQLPADEKPNAGAAQVAPGPCGDVLDARPGVSPVLFCARAAGHEGRHSYGGMFWGSSDSSNEDDTRDGLCGAQMPKVSDPATCVKPLGHTGMHFVGAGNLTGSTWYDPV